jgi:basic membrane protein A
MNKYRSFLFGLIGCFLCITACSDDDDENTTAAHATLTYVTAVSGLGDNGYNDLIMQGVMTFAATHPDVELSVRTPASTEEARHIVTNWQQSTAKDGGYDHLLLLGDADYASIFAALTTPLEARQRALLVEGDSASVSTAGVSTLWVRRYGAAYLAGCLAREATYAYVMAAYAGDTLLQDAIAGFCDGYHDAGGRTAEVHYLAEDASGYAQSNAAYRWLSDLGDSLDMMGRDPDAFIFPLAGGSNNGVYKYTRDREFSLLLVCGMDVDASSYSTRIPCSVVLHIDRIVNRLLAAWAESGSLPVHTEVGLEDPDAIEVVTTPTFFEYAAILKDYYIDPDYWTDGLAQYYSTALAKEVAYETQH